MEVELLNLVALEKYKKRLFCHVSKYLCKFLEVDVRTSYKIVRKAFGCWYFDGIRSGRVVDFLPTTDIVKVEDLIYLFDKMGKKYEPYEPFRHTFYIKAWKGPTPKVIKTSHIDTNKVEFVCGSYKCVISSGQYNRLKMLYNGPPGYIDCNIMILLMRYEIPGTKNNHLSIPPSLFDREDNIVELFGSPLNTFCDRYCSPFNTDKCFGSLGSFFEYKFTSDSVYIANPPFVEDIMIDMSHILIRALNGIDNITVYTILPAWDQKVSNQKYVALELLKESEYVLSHDILDKSTYPFFDYFEDKFIPVSDVHLIVLSNNKTSEISCSKTIKRKWEQILSNE